MKLNLLGTDSDSAKVGAFIAVIIMLVIFALSAMLVLRLYYRQGVYWDFITHILYSKALVNGFFYKSMLEGTLPLAISYGNHFYMEPFRAPLMSVLMVPFDLAFAQHAIPAYLLFEVLLLFLSAVYLARSLRVSPLVTAPMLMLPYVMVYLTVLNGTEILSLILVILAIALAAKGKWQSGIFIALAALAKYSSIVFVLPLLFIPKGTRMKALAAGFFTTLPWFVANSLVFGDPFYSYISAIQQAFVAPPPAHTSVYAALLISMNEVFYNLVPFVLIAVLLAALLYAKRRKVPKMSYKYRITAAFFIISILTWFGLAIHGSIATLPRWGYIVYAGSVPLLSLLIYDLIKASGRAFFKPGYRSAFTYALYVVLFLVFAALTLTAYTQMSRYPFGSFLGSKSAILYSAVHQVDALGLGDCNFVSNAWPYLRLYNITAHNPYYFNSSMYRYPIVVFNSFIGSGNKVTEADISKTYNFSGFQILIPYNSTC